MLKTLVAKNSTITYELTIKNVKNINLRIKSDGRILVSANPLVPDRVIDSFILSREEFILNALRRLKENTKEDFVCYFNETELKEFVLGICQRVYPYYEKKGIKSPQIKFRKMKSCWGNCRNINGIITFSTNLVYAPKECIEYVVYHEFTHLIVPNHSKEFYGELSLVCPDYKEKQKLMKNIKLPIQ